MNAWWNGRVQPIAEVRISPLDHGFLVGDGVFETLVARNGVPFAARRHWKRLMRSCEAMGMGCLSEEAYWEALNSVLRENDLPEARLRVTITSGDGPLGSGRGSSEINCVVVAAALKPWPETEKVVTSPWPVHESSALAGVKSTSYGANVRSLAFAKSKGCGEAMLLNSRNEICEGTGSNVFVVVAGRVKTPPLTAGCLAGTTREMVLEACADAGWMIEETDLPSSVLSECEEAFLTSSTRDVHPISEIDGRSLSPVPGPVTKRVQELYAAKAVSEPAW